MEVGNQKSQSETDQVASEKHPVFQVTALSKYLALALFVALPFLGGYVGYQLAAPLEDRVEYIKGESSVEIFVKLAYQYGSAYYYKPSDDQIYFFHLIPGDPRTDDEYLKSASIVEGADKSSFKVNPEGPFATDDDQVFLYGKAIPGADPKSFKVVDVLGGGPGSPMQVSGVDSQNFYVGYCQFSGVDIETVEGRGLRTFEDQRGQFVLVFIEERVGADEFYPRSNCHNYDLVREEN